MRAVNPRRPVDAIRPLDEVIDAAMGPRRLALQIIGAFAVMALVLAAVGVYGVASYGTQQRTKKLGSESPWVLKPRMLWRW